MILLLETATQVCSVALCHHGTVLHELHSDQPNAHSTRLPLLVEELLAHCGATLRQLDAVCVSRGPGSYTGLRIGVSSAKGYCYALGCPLLSVDTTQSLAMHYYMQHPDYCGIVYPMIDARRMECYTAAYKLADGMATPLRDVQAEVIEATTLEAWCQKDDVMLVGDGAPKTRQVLQPNTRLHYAEPAPANAAGMAPIAEHKLANHQYEDVAYFVPFYLKEFEAKKSIVRGLR